MSNIIIPADMIKGLVDKTILVEVANALKGPKGEALVEAIVKVALTEPENTYSRETKFGMQIKEMIRQVAQECAKEVLAEHRERIKATIKERMGKDADKWVEAVAAKLSDSVTSNFHVHVEIPSPER